MNQTFKAQLDLERHGGRTKPGVCARVLQRILALTAAIWHNETANRPGPARSLTAYDPRPGYEISPKPETDFRPALRGCGT